MLARKLGSRFCEKKIETNIFFGYRKIYSARITTLASPCPEIFVYNQRSAGQSRVYFKDILDSTTLSSSPLPYPPSPPLPLEVDTLNPARGLGSAVSSHSWVWGRVPAEFWTFVHFSLKI